MSENKIAEALGLKPLDEVLDTDTPLVPVVVEPNINVPTMPLS